MEKYAGYDDQSRIASGSVLSASASSQEIEIRSAPAREPSPQPNSRSKMYPALWDLMILMLAVVGGSVDAIVCRAFDALPGPQTGNTVLLGIALAHGQFSLAMARSAALFGYIVGAAIGQVMIVKHRGSWPWPSAAGTIEIVELMFLGALIVAWHLAGAHAVGTAKDIFVAMSAIAMGIQSAVVLDLPAEKPTTTYITGMLTTFVTQLIQSLHLIEASSESRSRHEISLARMSLAGPWIYGLTWLVYLSGAVAGGLLFSPAHENALLLPIVLLAAVVLLGRAIAAPAETQVLRQLV
jgi:uncharacterized membrane protein YoaK (UPF0700 family)